MIALIRERLGARGRRATASSSTASRARCRRPRRSTRCCARSAATLDVVFEFQLADAVGVERMLRRAAEEGRADDTPEAIDERLAALPPARPSRSIEYYRARGNLVGIHADRPVDEVFARDPAGARAGGGPMIIRKAAGEIERMARAGEVVADTLALLGEHARPGVTHAGARRARRRVHPLARRHPDLQGLPRLPGLDLRLAERDGRPRHPGPLRAARGRRPLGGRRRDARRLRRRLGATRSRSARSPTRPSACSRAARPRSPPGSSSAASATGSPTSRTRSSVATEEHGFSVVRSLVGHGVGRSMHEEPQIPNYGEPGRGPLLAEGMTFAIEPMINAGSPDVVAARRRVVDLERGRLALRPLRAHRRDHRRRARGS